VRSFTARHAVKPGAQLVAFAQMAETFQKSPQTEFAGNAAQKFADLKSIFFGDAASDLRDNVPVVGSNRARIFLDRRLPGCRIKPKGLLPQNFL
jgi:hypothetical protein